MLQDIVMPKLGLTMSEGSVARWIVSAGEPYKKGDPLFEAVTDKISFTIEAQADGRLVEILVKEGDTVPVGAVVARAEVGGASSEAKATQAAQTEASSTGSTRPGSPEATASSLEASDRGLDPGGDSVPASPAARKLAREHHVDLAGISGTGPGGRIVEGDVRAFLDKALGMAADAIASASGAHRAGTGRAEQSEAASSGTKVPYTAIGRTSAERTTLSFRTAPHFYISMDVQALPLLAFREALGAEAYRRGDGRTPRPSINDVIVMVVARSLAEHRYVNACAVQDGIVVYQDVNIGVAVATDEGLVVPVVRNADVKTVWEIAAETRELARRARDGGLEPRDVSGGTFTVSNLGMFGVDELCAVINPPQAAILGVGSVRELPIVMGGTVIPGMIMRLTLSADHRVLDGARAARFLRSIKDGIESLMPEATTSL